MSNILSVNSGGTPKNFTDFSRNRYMLDADKIFNRLGLNNMSASDLLNKMSDLSTALENTKYYQLDQSWNDVESIFNKGKPVSTKADTDVGKYITAISFFYNALNVMDQQGSYRGISAMKSSFLSLYDKVSGSIANHQTAKDKRSINTTLTSIATRMNKVIETINTKIDNGELNAPKLTTV